MAEVNLNIWKVIQKQVKIYAQKKDDFYDVCCSKVPETEVVPLVGYFT